MKFSTINHYIQGDSGQKPKTIEVTDQLLSSDSSSPSPCCPVRPFKSASIIIFWSCSSIAALDQLPSHLGIPCLQQVPEIHHKSKFGNTGRVFSLGENGFSSLSKRVVVVGRAKWQLAKSNQKMQSPLEWCSCTKSLCPSCKNIKVSQHTCWTSWQAEPGTLLCLGRAWQGVLFRQKEAWLLVCQILGLFLCCLPPDDSQERLCGPGMSNSKLTEMFFSSTPTSWLVQIVELYKEFPAGLGVNTSMLKTYRLSQTVFCTKVTRPRGLQTKAFSIL